MKDYGKHCTKAMKKTQGNSNYRGFFTYIYIGFLSVNVSHNTDAAGVTGLVARN